MPLTIKPASGSGSATLISVAGTTTNDTLTLPAKTGNIITSADTGTVTSGMLASGAARTNFGTGAVLQVVSATYGTATSNSSISYVATGLTASITPSSASNKILVIANVSGVSVANTGNGVNLGLYRGVTGLTTFAVANAFSGSGTTVCGGSSVSYLDSPSATTSTTYSVSFASLVAGQTASVQLNNAFSTIVLLEIAG